MVHRYCAVSSKFQSKLFIMDNLRLLVVVVAVFIQSISAMVINLNFKSSKAHTIMLNNYEYFAAALYKP